MSLCDKEGPQGPQNERYIKLCSLIQKSVDFAKHGVPVDPADWAEYDRDNQGKYPDYMSKDENSYESPHILGLLYRAVQVDQTWEKGLRREFYYSIKHEYTLLPWVANVRQLGQISDHL
jgi:hypothetical protein